MLDTFASLSGLIASIWIIFGVYIAGKFYPNYSHSKQFCSELGAKNSPTEKLSPWINNYPLGLLFCIFGWYISYISDSLPLTLTGMMVVIHGIGTLVAGYYPMDADPYTKKPSVECKIHSWAGMFVLLSLLVAPICALFSTEQALASIGFTLLSILSVIVSVSFLVKMTKVFKRKGNTAGLYQRLAYGTQLFWLSGLSILIMK
ncbi:DUF998 domain-containing protein [Shewanella sp. 202IG2-18]|uniref:DUF998 domain-containing protein n=1 Tax=Parashewanella hymeniacidonis TaxID=2807618 RepID=UPI0019600753|nr:DUF998 domain-containing protein [Parashewanella hymeniacidonis]MBM7074010.1 DUF998 domain-containing protein [Parashewanella hymeniacidonis]